MKFLQFLFLIFGLFASSNGQKAILSGNVTDKWGAVIPNAKIEAKNFEGKIFAALTNDDGNYQLELNEGEYDIEFIKTPFDKFLVSNYWINYKMQFDVALQCKDCELIDEDMFKSEPAQTVAPSETKVSDQVLQKPSEKLPKRENKYKRKNKNNK